MLVFEEKNNKKLPLARENDRLLKGGLLCGNDKRAIVEFNLIAYLAPRRAVVHNHLQFVQIPLARRVDSELFTIAHK